MNEEELRARLNRGIAAPPEGGVERVMRGARARALDGRRPGLAAIIAMAVAVAVLLVGGASLLASLKASRVPAPVAPLVSPSPGPSPVGSPSPAPSPTTAPTPVPPPSAGPLVVLPTMAQVIPASGAVVWVTIVGIPGQLLFRSQDQGASWQQRTLPATSGTVAKAALSFLDANRGWYLQTGSPETQCAGQAAGIWRTVDGAATWQNLGGAATSQGPGANGIDLIQCKDSLSFVDAQTGFMTGWDQNSRPVVYRTANGGVTWTKSALLPDPPDQRTAAGGFTLRPGTVARFGSDLVVDGQGWQHLYVYRSRDGGATWSWVATIPGASDGDEVSFLDAAHWWLSGAALGPNYRYTADAGGHYAQAPGSPNSAAPISPVFTFLDLNLGYATVRGSIWKTLDGGTHWTTVSTPGT